MNIKYAKYLIKKTKADYDKISQSFSESRAQLWPELKELKKYVKKSERVLDLGCGNGRLLELFRNENIKYIGVDSSENLIKEAQKKYSERFKVVDILNLPFDDNYFDSVWSIAVLHHIPSKELRLKVLKEIKRVLKRNGKVIITCWNLYQLRYLRILLKSTIRKILGLSRLDFKDAFLSWQNTGVQRYYHAFTKRELKKLFQKAGFKVEKLKSLKRKDKKTNILIVGAKQS
jgi:ubiquinone/menaquinone biosynthesis C-methylase UbiE